ncbi:hypothetical protein HID58_086491 [Brassica napus]|uniref:Uncharacterized protein n=1 Tax=Brassica napus TaxID=3708 RepID=A0ABQ7XQI4_BRANA|nr:hypothetical protein HID58_086491 [Brassica napus]
MKQKLKLKFYDNKINTNIDSAAELQQMTLSFTEFLARRSGATVAEFFIVVRRWQSIHGLPERGEEEKPGVETVRSKFEEFSGFLRKNKKRRIAYPKKQEEEQWERFDGSLPVKGIREESSVNRHVLNNPVDAFGLEACGGVVDSLPVVVVFVVSKRVLRFGEDRAFLSFRLVVLPIGQSDSFFLREGGDPVNAFGLEACGGVVDSLPVVVVFVVSKRVLRFGEDRAFLSFRLVVLPIGQSDSFFLREGGDPVDAFGLEACGGVVDSLPVVVVFVVSKRVLRFGEDRASLSFRLVVLPIGQSDSFFLREGGGNRRRLVHRGVVAVWWLHVCGLARIAAVCSPESVVYGCAPLILVAALPLLNHPHFIYRLLLLFLRPHRGFLEAQRRPLGLAGVGVAILSFVIPVRGRSRSLGLLADGLRFGVSSLSARCFNLSGSVAAVASACSFRVAFQALCGVNYKPGFGGFARSLGKYLDLPSIARLALHDSDATPETTYEFPGSEATRRISPFCDSSSMVRTPTGFRRISKNELGECAGFSGRAKLRKAPHAATSPLLSPYRATCRADTSSSLLFCFEHAPSPSIVPNRAFL